MQHEDDFNYDEIDAPIRSLVQVLNAFPGARTIGSCGSHDSPKGDQAGPGCWWVLIGFDRSDDAWLSLEFLGWAVTRVLGSDGTCTLEADAAPPYLNHPGRMLRFILQRHEPVERPHSDGEGFAAELARLRDEFFVDSTDALEYEMDSDDHAYLAAGLREAVVLGDAEQHADAKHSTVRVRLGTEDVDVDELMAGLVAEAFRAGIDTNGSCQDAGSSIVDLLVDLPHLDRYADSRRGRAYLQFPNRRSMVDFHEAVALGGPRDELYERMMHWAAPNAWTRTLSLIDDGDEPDAPARPRLDVSCYHVEFPQADISRITDRVRRFNSGEPVDHAPATWSSVSLPSRDD